MSRAKTKVEKYGYSGSFIENPEFAEWLKSELKLLGISQANLAKQVGVSKKVINDYCTGRTEPPLQKYLDIIAALER